jgi:hypothetical protein
VENIQIQVEGNKAIITIDLDKRGSRSKSGKTISVASTRGGKKIPGTDVALGLNAYIKP